MTLQTRKILTEIWIHAAKIKDKSKKAVSSQGEPSSRDSNSTNIIFLKEHINLLDGNNNLVAEIGH